MTACALYGQVLPQRLLRPLRPGELTPPHEDARSDAEALDVLEQGGSAWALDPYAGCELACAHCGALSARTSEPGAPPSAPRVPSSPRVLAKQGAAELLRSELRRAAAQGQLTRTIVLGAASDPWQPLEARERVTRSLLQVLLEVAERAGRDHAPRLLISTRSPLVVRDLELLRALDRALHLRVGISLTTLDPDLAARLEPGAPAPARRLGALEALARAGLVAGVLCQPVLPELTESPRDLRRVVCAARAARARFLGARLLSLRGEGRRVFFGWLGRERPDLLRAYARMYHGPLPPEAVRERVRRVLSALRAQYGLVPWVSFPALPDAQRGLFGSARGAPLPTLRIEPAA